MNTRLINEIEKVVCECADHLYRSKARALPGPVSGEFMEAAYASMNDALEALGGGRLSRPEKRELNAHDLALQILLLLYLTDRSSRAVMGGEAVHMNRLEEALASLTKARESLSWLSPAPQ